MRYVWMSAALVVVAGVVIYVLLTTVPEKQRAYDDVHLRNSIETVGADSGELTGAPQLGGPELPEHSTSLVHEASATTMPQRIASAPYAATERAMLSGGMINDTAIMALQSKHFDRLLTRFESEQGGMTGEITVAYRAELQRLLGSVVEQKQIDRVVCGTELCIASIRSPSRAWYPAWFDSMQGRSNLPMNALTGNSIDLAGSGVEYRLLFSISDGVKGFAGSAPRS